MQFGFQKKQKKSYGMKLIEIHYFYFLFAKFMKNVATRSLNLT